MKLALYTRVLPLTYLILQVTMKPILPCKTKVSKCGKNASCGVASCKLRVAYSEL